MFLEHFHLREQPFGVTPDPRFLCLGPSHREAMASLLYGIHSGRGFMALIAEPGMGKTTLLFELLRSLGSSAKTVFVFQTQCSPDDFLRSILSDLGIAHRGANLVEMQSRLNQVMLKEAAAGRRVVVAIDEAQNLEEPVLELLRMLSNFETPREKLMQIILTGQPQLATKLSSLSLVQLRQRISIFGRLQPLTAPEINSYIDHRLRIAGYQSRTSLFTDSAKAMIVRYSRGIPRDINNICFNALSLACALKHKSIDTPVIQEVLHDLDLRPLQTQAASALIAPRERLRRPESSRLQTCSVATIDLASDFGSFRSHCHCPSTVHRQSKSMDLARNVEFHRHFDFQASLRVAGTHHHESSRLYSSAPVLQQRRRNPPARPSARFATRTSVKLRAVTNRRSPGHFQLGRASSATTPQPAALTFVRLELRKNISVIPLSFNSGKQRQFLHLESRENYFALRWHGRCPFPFRSLPTKLSGKFVLVLCGKCDSRFAATNYCY